jgi:eukaryotic-like serine/threonine-protein kinase
MPAPSTTEEFLELVRKSGVVEEKRLDAYLAGVRASGKLPDVVGRAAGLLVRDGIVTHFQAEQFLQGKWRRFTIGKYKVLDRIGSGGMGSVYLCEHKLMRRRAAVKVLPTSKASDAAALDRFYREARAVAALDHPNIVRAYDIDQEEQLHFLVMEYVEGSSLQDIVKQSGPLDPVRAAQYIGQAAQGLQHAHEAGLVHRDIKPGNLIVDRCGIVKILDMGLARFFNDEDDLLTKKYGEDVLGTADYLAPEQALDSHGVDIRADIYGLGATFYYCLTGKTPFGEGSVAQKLIWHQTRRPKPISALRSDVPPSLSAVVDKMMAKDPDQRYQQPLEVVQALAPWIQMAPATNAPDRSGPGGTGDSERSAADAAAAASRRAATAARLARNWEVKTPPRPAAPGRPAGASPSPAGPATSSPPAAPATSPPPPGSSPPPGQAPSAAQEPPASGEIEELTVPAPTGAQADEDGLCWEKLASDTAEMAAQGDTAPRTNPKAARKSNSRLTPIRKADQRRLWWIVGAVSGIVLLIIVLLWLSGSGTPTAAPALPRRPAHHLSTLTVSKSSRFPRIMDALAAARDGDQIVVAEDNIEEALHLDGSATKVPAVVIQPAEGKMPVWRLPKNADSSKCLIYLNGVRGLQIHGFTLDGEGKMEELVLLTGSCPGLTLQDLRLTRFKTSGIRIINCAGTADQPVTLSGLWLQPEAPCESGIAFVVNPSITDPRRNENFVLRNCLWIGSYRNRVQLPPRSAGGAPEQKLFHEFSGNKTRELDPPAEKGKPRSAPQPVPLENPEN